MLRSHKRTVTKAPLKTAKNERIKYNGKYLNRQTRDKDRTCGYNRKRKKIYGKQGSEGNRDYVIAQNKPLQNSQQTADTVAL